MKKEDRIHHHHHEELINNINVKYHLHFRSLASIMHRGSKVEKDIHTFLSTQCHKTHEQIHSTFFNEHASLKIVMDLFKDHLESRIEKEKEH